MFNIYTANTSRYFNTELDSYYQKTLENLLDQLLLHGNTCYDLVFSGDPLKWKI